MCARSSSGSWRSGGEGSLFDQELGGDAEDPSRGYFGTKGVAGPIPTVAATPLVYQQPGWSERRCSHGARTLRVAAVPERAHERAFGGGLPASSDLPAVACPFIDAYPGPRLNSEGVLRRQRRPARGSITRIFGRVASSRDGVFEVIRTRTRGHDERGARQSRRWSRSLTAGVGAVATATLR
jgi:hypothetical protein